MLRLNGRLHRSNTQRLNARPHHSNMLRLNARPHRSNMLRRSNTLRHNNTLHRNGRPHRSNTLRRRKGPSQRACSGEGWFVKTEAHGHPWVFVHPA
jgi:hypothetical protein